MKILKKILLVVLLIITILFLYLKSQISDVKGNKTNFAKSERIKEDLDSILNTEKPRNSENLTALNKVADFISYKFKLVSDSVTEQKFPLALVYNECQY